MAAQDAIIWKPHGHVISVQFVLSHLYFNMETKMESEVVLTMTSGLPETAK